MQSLGYALAPVYNTTYSFAYTTGYKLLPMILGFAYEDHHNMDLMHKGIGLVYKDQMLILVLLLMALGIDPKHIWRLLKGM